MTVEQDNSNVVRELFAAFGRGDVKAVLNLFDDRVEFQSPVTRNAPPEVSWSKVRNGKEEVAAFFGELGSKMQIEAMNATKLFAAGEHVAVEGMNRGTVRSTGAKYEHDWVMIFSFRNGKITRCVHYYDTADLVVAFH